MSVSVVIVGCGPAGFYAAESILAQAPEWKIDMLDRLPTPYGLVRAGVAPDHQSTKKVVRKFDAIGHAKNVRFLGNVSIGGDVSYAELKSLYDVVILAAGSEVSRKLGLPGEDAKGIFGAGMIVGWYNGHPDFRTVAPDLSGKSAVVIGNGNVALDVARVFAATPGELAVTDIAPYAATAIGAGNIEDIHIIGRRGPGQASFTRAELRELGRLERAVPLVEEAQIPESIEVSNERERRIKEGNLKVLRGYVGNDRGLKPVRVHLKFFMSPVEFLTARDGDHTRVRAVRVEKTRLEDNRAVGTGEFIELPADIVVTCIGYKGNLPEGVPIDPKSGVVRNQDGFVEPGVYVVGWAKRGPTGTIATNRHDSHGVVDLAVAAFSHGGGEKPGAPALTALLAERGVRFVTFEEWEKIDAEEISRAKGGAPREKLTSVEDMLDVLDAKP